MSVCWTEKAVLTLKLNLIHTNTDSRAHGVDPCLAPGPSWYPFCWLHLPRPPATREAGERSGIPQAYVLHDTTAHTQTQRGRVKGPLPSQHTPSHSITTTHTDLNTLAQGRTRKRKCFLISEFPSHVTERCQTTIWTNKHGVLPGIPVTKLSK